MSNPLMTSKRFAPLFWTQFLSAFNDNFLKNSLVFLILFTLVSDQAAALITLAGAVFMAPFLLLSALGGQIADRYDKALITRRLKLAEIGAAFLSVVGVATHSITILMLALLCFGIISALFGPVKYGILPDHLERSELPSANAWLEGSTFLAILAGTIGAGFAAGGGISVLIFGPLMMSLAVICWLCSRQIPRTGSAAPDLVIDRNIIRSTMQLVDEVRGDRRLWMAAVMSGWFWIAGAIMLSILPVMVKDILGGNESAVTFYLAIFAIAVGVGSALAAWMSAGRIILLPAPIGTLFMALFGLDLAWCVWGLTAHEQAASLAAFLSYDYTIRVAIDLAGMAIFGAFLVVPTFSALQAWAPEAHRSRVVAAANVLSAGFVTIGGVMVALMQALGVSISGLLIGLALANLSAAYLMLRYLPTSPFRDFISIFFRAFHRMEITGLENIAKAGKAPILALNHVSFLDGPLALALTDEEPVFAIDYQIARMWWVRPFMKMCKAMPLDPSKPMATRTLIKAVNNGDPLVIFPEGRITVTGALMKVYDGAAMVADKTGSLVVPVRIDGLEKSLLFSRLTRQHVRRRLFPKLKVTILEPVKLTVPEEYKGRQRRALAGTALYQLMSELVFRTTAIEGTVLEKIIAAAHEHGMNRLAVEDPLGGKMSYGKMLTGAAVLAVKFNERFRDDKMLGIMLPNANGAAVTLCAVWSAGKVAAMLNFTAGAKNMIAACQAAEISNVVTSRAFIEAAKLAPVIEALEKTVTVTFLEDFKPDVSFGDKLKGMWNRSNPLNKRTVNDLAVVMFTSGSEGTPKGVALSNRNLLANAAQCAARIEFNSSDKVFNILPVFHSFGMTAGTILPLIYGVPVYFYPSPLHYRIVPELIYNSNASIIFGTDTFLNGYARTAHAYDFRSIRYCFAGAEPVKKPTRDVYMEKFGIRILEGYGVTETAPVIALNTPMYNRYGSVGRALPGMTLRLDPMPGIDEGGRLYVKGPNIMEGYLRAENPGKLEKPEEGWHDTGDIVTIDESGFIFIRGRAKRFAKIAGEMVSLSAIEDIASKLWPGELSVITTVVDARKGEKLILLTEAEKATRDAFLKYAKANGVHDMMVPAEIRIGKVPLLGSGKIDFTTATKMTRGELD